MSAGRKCRTCGVWKPAADYAPGIKGCFGRSCMACLEAAAREIDARIDRGRARRASPAWHNGRLWVRRCSDCGEVKPLRAGFYRVTTSSGRARFAGICRACHATQSYEARKARLTDPVLAARERESHRLRQERERKAKPERERKRRKREWQKLKADPERYARERELARINYRLRRQRAGLPVKAKPSRRGAVMVPSSAPGSVPVAPLVAFIEKRIEQRKAVVSLIDGARNTDGVLKAVCDDLGVSDRTYRRWRTDRGEAGIGLVEKVLLNADVEWYDVYSYDDHAAVFLAHDEVEA